MKATQCRRPTNNTGTTYISNTYEHNNCIDKEGVFSFFSNPLGSDGGSVYHRAVMSQPFCHLHVHTSYSLLDGASKINQLVEQAVALEQPALAITDHGVMYGIVEFQKACKAAGVKPILGCETYINPTGSRKEKTPGDPINHLVLLAENNVGYSNLCKLISASHLEGFYYKPRVDKELLAEHSEGIIGLSACLKGEITQHLAQDKLDRAEKAANAYKEIFGKDNFFLEIQDHGIAEQRRANTLTKTLCERTGLRAVATNDVHYLIKAHAEAHEMLLCLQTGDRKSVV